jgi:hypothetical protein
MAIKVQGTTIIDDDKSIKNAFTVYQQNTNNAVFWGNFNRISSNTTLANSHNNMSIGPIEIADNVVVTIATDANWVIV